MVKSPAERKASEIHTTRVCLREARARRQSHPVFAKTLLEWSANARRRAAAIDLSPAQGDFFGRAA